MKIYNRLFIGTSLCLAVCSCADQGLLPFPGELQVPDELTQNANLQEYDILKNYVNRTDNPGFKLGIAVDENEFIDKGAAFSIAQTNFDDVTPGNAMKYSSVVKDDGTMDFSTVELFIETAEAAGLTVYGHTLCWHSQQNLTYLNGLLRGGASKAAKNYVMSRADEQNKFCLKLTGIGEEKDAQAYYELPNSGTFPSGTYTFSCRTKSSVAISEGNLVFQASDHNIAQAGEWGVFNSSTSWSNFSATITIPNEFNNKCIRFFIQFKAGAGDYVLIDDVSLTLNNGTNYIDNSDFETGETTGWKCYDNILSIFNMSDDTEGGEDGDVTYTELLENGDFENGQLSSCYIVQNGGTTYEFKDDTDHGKVLAVKNPTTQTNDHDSQFIFSIPAKAQVGEVYVFSMDVKSDVAATIKTQAQSAPGTYLHWNMFGDINSTTDWQTITKEITIGSGAEGWEGLGAVAFNLGLTATTYYFDNVSFQKKVIEGEEMTDEEKHDVIYAALDTWIKNMMETCAGRVKVWDVVNEPISGGGNVDGYYELQSASNGDPTNNFYWQDYLGDDEFVRDAVKLARKYFEEYGGNPNDLKLFVNDYNLESDWDTNKKLRSLIYWIDRWENNGEIYIDGIGTQMHVSCSMNPETQKSRENAVENMFKLMAQTGKLIKISEIDMGITDEDGEKILTTDVTYVQLLHMADYYNFIIRKYFEIIPAEYRYGITQWSITDAGNEDYAWRKGEPIGLWTKEYERKPAYAGFADGLAGTEKSYLGWASSMDSTTGDETSENAE